MIVKDQGPNSNSRGESYYKAASVSKSKNKSKDRSDSEVTVSKNLFPEKKKTSPKKSIPSTKKQRNDSRVP